MGIIEVCRRSDAGFRQPVGHDKNVADIFPIHPQGEQILTVVNSVGQSAVDIDDILIQLLLARFNDVNAVVYQLHDAILGHQVGQSRQAALIVGHLVVDLAEISLDCSAQNAQISNNPGVFIQL